MDLPACRPDPSVRMPSADPSSAAPWAVEVRTPARIHLGMLSFGQADARSFGGVGVMLDRPGVHLRARRSSRFEARGPDAERALRFARECIQRGGFDARPCAIEVVAAPRPHVGLGSGTQLGLAVAAAVRHLSRAADDDADAEAAPAHPHERPPEVGDHEHTFDIPDALELARLSGRGRRSCVGVYGFTRGGLIIEAGRTSEAVGAGDAGRPVSPLVSRVRLPAAWRCVVIVGRDATGLHGDAERAAFAALPPMPREVSAELARTALLELLPAAVEGRFTEFCAALYRYGRLAGEPFAQASRALPHAAATDTLLELLTELGAPGCAQSSWGPAVVACCESLEAAGELVDRLDHLALGDHHDILISRFDTQGASLRVIS
jgi:beta-ribofuranosylaminobenzene 5'-phosphate synthase